ncbi:uncharacterized protein LOC134787822 [Penaeus indicus]|uniref:uncharacterized protein LOC134787822 n=1 Tax=Penaeus indicus TaxID=29960 RepID=UPI00300CC942
MAGNKQQVVHWNDGNGPAVAITGVAWPRRWPRQALARSESRYKKRRGSRGPHWVDGAPTLRISRLSHVSRVAASLASARPGAGRRPCLSVSCHSRLSSATMMRLLVLVTAACLAHSLPFPDHPPAGGGFQPIHGSRGSGPASGYGAPLPPSPGYGAPGPAGSTPTKTIYVNVPHPEPQKPLPPVAAGPPRKHYKIVFIRAPAPQPPPQPILPPRTEQKTLIYVLHQRPEVQEQQVIQVPSVKHNPEVFFVQYDNPPTAEELQQLSAGDLSGFTVSSQASGGGYGGGDSLALGSAREDQTAVLADASDAGIGSGVSFGSAPGVSVPALSGGGIPSTAVRIDVPSGGSGLQILNSVRSSSAADDVLGLGSLESAADALDFGDSLRRRSVPAQRT